MRIIIIQESFKYATSVERMPSSASIHNQLRQRHLDSSSGSVDPVHPLPGIQPSSTLRLKSLADASSLRYQSRFPSDSLLTTFRSGDNIPALGESRCSPTAT